MEPVRLGVIGCGVIGQVHLQMAKESGQARIVAVADLRETAAREAAAKFGAERVYADAGALLDDRQVEAVTLALPAAGRAAVALRAFARGKHVLLEKPVAMNAGEVRRLIKARGGLIAGCCSARFRGLRHVPAVTDYVASGALGALRVVHCRAIGPAGPPPGTPPPEWRLKKSLNGGGILVNWGCYDLDYLLGITGWQLQPREVLAQTWTVPPAFTSRTAPGSDAETHVAALIRCDGGAVISYERAEFAAAQDDPVWRIVGTDGSLRLQMTPVPDHKILRVKASAEHGAVTETLWEGQEDGALIHAGVVRDFFAAVREHRSPMTNLEQALVLQRITDAIYASADRGCAVKLR